MYLKKFSVLIVLVLSLFLTGCTVGSYVTYNSIETNNAKSMSMRHEKFKGFKSRTVKFDEPIKLDVDISTESGSLKLTITDEDGKTYYEESDLVTSHFSVDLDKAGKYTIRFDGEDHKGSYKVTWDSED